MPFEFLDITPSKISWLCCPRSGDGLRIRADVKLREITTIDVLWVSPKHTNEECMPLMTTKRIRHLPVLDSGKVNGLIRRFFPKNMRFQDSTAEDIDFAIHSLNHRPESASDSRLLMRSS